MIGLLKYLFLDKKARQALARTPAGPVTKIRPRAGAPAPPRERDAKTAIAEAEARMRVLPPAKAQLIRTALLVHRAQQSALSEIPDEQFAKLAGLARRALLGQQDD